MTADNKAGLVANVAVWLAVGVGVGRWSPFAPGTFGTLLGLPVAWGIARLDGAALQTIAVVALCIAGVFIVNGALPHLGGLKDPGCVVFDEISGLAVTFCLVPMTSLTIALLGFLLFRLFDITKPSPARNFEKLPDGLGVMADDWVAGIYANLALRGILAVAPSQWFAF